MNTHGLRLFYQVAKIGSFTKAAEQLNISQPAVSSQIKKFEHEIGVPLFQQNGRKAVLTEFGIALAGKAEHLFSLEKQIEAFIDDYRNGEEGTIRIATTYLPANLLLPKLAASFKREHEKVNLVISTSNTKDAFDQLQHYKADIAIYGGIGERPENVDWYELLEDELWFVVGANHRLANQTIKLEEMVKEPFIMREEGSSMREHLVSLCYANQLNPPKVALQFDGLSETISTVISGYGANFISSLVVKDHIKNGQLARVYVEGVSVQHRIAICTRKNEEQSILVKQFIEKCKQNIRKNY
ncbi:LysR family transcriptional regulator [Cytobacillus sp. FSL W7-1323]|uniref:LysR family transcriptional regulator n=1 Tax=Cytobacillus kochii TaxID=859143 RepID=A0A248TEP7_9BACI|nr:LysR family transcriptional regulator [Cytobacillus kochii]ASV66675.1 LysR family transcriptional regulator [Cytobacillus kochii]MCA1024794.1 LysR family transcriptional regulator [Cytobacillus kochii]MCM3323723.1 LysR family transcriptional regulator [Cytobacillus kochii]MCM3346096.1 LysR family transcriptional regulator [Cytobacillus kochii]MDM5206487.1 LysR family transcriptional regulator [Cytobacillus kochii]